VFHRIIDKYFGGNCDERTIALLEASCGERQAGKGEP
jgi:hypothetical protein